MVKYKCSQEGYTTTLYEGSDTHYITTCGSGGVFNHNIDKRVMTSTRASAYNMSADHVVNVL